MNQEKERFTGTTMAEALASARARFGPEAEILTGRRAKGRNGGYEVWARLSRQRALFPMSAETTDLLHQVLRNVRSAQRQGRPDGRNSEIVRTAQGAGPGSAVSVVSRLGASGHAAYRLDARPGAPPAAPLPSASASASASTSTEGDLRTEVARLRRDLNLLLREAVGTSKNPRLEEALRNEGFSTATARDLAGGESGIANLRACLEARLRAVSSDEEEEKNAASASPRIVCFAGPSGAGKTTTLAKRASQFRFDAGSRVAFVQADPERVGADAQLGQYAELLGAPVATAHAPEELLEAAVRYAKEYDCVLVDTPGGWSRRGEIYAHLERRGFDAGLRWETGLCLPLPSDRAVHDAVLASMEPVRSLAIHWTKADEAGRWGHAIDAASAFSRPISHVTTGEGVPDEIEEAVPAKIAAGCLARLEACLA